MGVTKVKMTTGYVKWSSWMKRREMGLRRENFFHFYRYVYFNAFSETVLVYRKSLKNQLQRLTS